MTYRYLVSATGYKENKASGSTGYAPRSFMFEIVTEEPWNDGKWATQQLRGMADKHCHRLYGFWPRHPPQIDAVTLVTDPLQRIKVLVAGADAAGAWGDISAHDILALIPDIEVTPVSFVSDGTDEEKPLEAPVSEGSDDDEFDSLI